jgi:hypothetical protein
MDQETYDRIVRIEHKLDVLLAHLGAGQRRPGAAAAPGAPPEIATDADIEGPRGNPEVRFDPKRWEGQSFKGRTFSDCPPEFLEMLAETLEYFARKNDQEGAVDKNGGPKSRWERLDASRARAWAKRLRGSSGGRAARPAQRQEPRRQAPLPVDPGPPAGFDDRYGPGSFEDGGDDDIPF